MANQPPAGRWMRMATLRPMSNPTQDPPSPQPPAPRPVLGRTFTAVPFRPAVPTVPAPVAALPPAPTTAPPRQVAPTLPDVTAIRSASVRLAAGTNEILSPKGAPSTASVSNGVPSPQRAPSPAATTAKNGLPSPQKAPNENTTANSVPSPQLVPNAAITKGAVSQQSPLGAPNINPSPQKYYSATTASPVPHTSSMKAGNGAQKLSSPQVNSPIAPHTITNTTSPISKAPYTPQFYMPKSPSQQAPVVYHSPAASPSPQKQPVSPPNFTPTTSAPAPRIVTFSNIQSFPSPTKSQASPAASKPQIPSPNTSNPPDGTPPHSPQTMSMTPPPSPLHLPPPLLQQDHKIPQEPEQKSILFQQTSEKYKPSTANSPNQKIPQITKHTKPATKHIHPDYEHINQTIITIAGQNRSALMNLSQPCNTHSQFSGNPQKLSNPNNSKFNVTESDQSNGSKHKPKAVCNSNVQGINNSVMFNTRIAHRDPGVHVALSRKHKG